MDFEIGNGIYFNSETLKIFINGIPSNQEKSALKKKKNHKLPNLVFLAATNCNLACSYCYADEGTYNTFEQKRKIDVDDFIKSYDEMTSIYGGVGGISFFGGEPLLNFKNIKAFINYIDERDGRVPRLSINSNGTIFTDEILEFFKKYNVVLGTSLDGIKLHHDQNRFSKYFKGSYEIVVENIKKFANSNVDVFVQFTLNKTHIENYSTKEAENWYKQMELLPIKNYDLIPVSTNDPRFKIDLTDEIIKNNFQEFCYDSVGYYISKIKNGQFHLIPKIFMSMFLRILLKEYHSDCSAGYSVTITPDMSVYPCHVYSGEKNLGISLQSFKDTLLEENHPFFIERDMKRENVEKCKNCIAMSICGVWCKGLNKVVNGESLSTLDERCFMMEIYLREVIKFLAINQLKNSALIREIIKFNNNHMDIVYGK